MDTRPQPGVSQLLSTKGFAAVVSVTISWDFCAAPLLSLVGMIFTLGYLGCSSAATASALGTSRSHRYMVFTVGIASAMAMTIVRPMTPAPTRQAVSVLEGAVYFASRPPTAEVRIAVTSVPSRMQNGSTVSGSLRMVMSMP